MNLIAVMRAAGAVSRASLRLERPDRIVRNIIVSSAIGPSVAGAIAGATARDPHRLAIADDTAELNYGGLWGASQAFAGVLREAGVGEHATVGLVADNSSDFVVAVVAISILGADLVLLNTASAAPQLGEVIAREGCTHVVADAVYTTLAGQACRLPVVEIVVSAPPRRWIVPSRRLARTIIMTSGTTGRPKGASRRGASIAAATMLDAIPIRSGDRVVIACPLFHSWGFAHTITALSLGSTVVLSSSLRGPEVLAKIQRHKADGMVVVPSILQRLVGQADPGDVPASLRYVASSGSAVPTWLVRATLDRFGPVLYNSYGSTEAGLATVASPTDLARFPSTAGRALAGVVIKILDDDSQPVPDGILGSVFVDSGAAFDGYSDGADKRRIGGLVDTGDVGSIIDGLLFIAGRSDDMIISGGENVFPVEVEDLIASLDGVVEAAVVGVDDDEFGQRLSALVVAAPGGPDHDEVRRAVGSRLARFKVPRDVVFVEALPRNATGKVLRAQVAETIAELVSMAQAER